MKNIIKKQHGATLLQVLIGMAVGAFVLIIAAQMYYTIRQSYTRTAALTAGNHEARLVETTIKTMVDRSSAVLPNSAWPWLEVDYRLPGFIHNVTTKPFILDYPYVYAATSLQYYNTSGNTMPPGYIAGTALLMLQGTVGSIKTTQIITQNNNNFQPGANISSINIGKNDFVLLSDDTGYQVMRANNDATTTVVHVEQGPIRDYAAGSVVSKYHTYIIYLRENSGIRSLYLLEDYSPTDGLVNQELIRGVDDFQIQFFDGNTWQAIAADSLENRVIWANKNIKGIRVIYTIDGRSYTIDIALKKNLL